MYEPVKLFVCSTPFVFLSSIVLTALFPLFYVVHTSPVRFTGSYTEAEWAEIGFRHKSGKNKKNLQMRLWNGREGGFLTTIQIVLPAPSLPLRVLPIYCHPSSWVANHTHISVFSLPLWRLFVPHIVTDGMLAFTKEWKTRNEMVKFSMFCLGFKV